MRNKSNGIEEEEVKETADEVFETEKDGLTKETKHPDKMIIKNARCTKTRQLIQITFRRTCRSQHSQIVRKSK